MKMNLLCKHPFLAVFGTALILRGVFALFYLSSPFRFFHTVPGLDMETLLRFGEWGTQGNSFFFTCHRLYTFLFWKMNNGVHPVMWHVLWQALLGAAGAVMLSDVLLKLTGKKSAALCAGLLWALNPVELMYEFTTLQDSLVNFGVILSFWSFLHARKHHFAPLCTLGAGAAAGVAATGRPVAVGLVFLLFCWNIFYIYRRKLPLKRIFPFAGAILLAWGIFSTVNYFKSSSFNCFFNPIAYTIAVNTSEGHVQKHASVPASPQAARLLTTGAKMVSRIPLLWNTVELPENLNIYFLRQQIPLLKLPFEFIMLLASVGTLLLIFSGKWRKKEGLLLLPVFSLVFFLCVRDPIGRYRLLLLPWFTLISVWTLFYCMRRKKTALICGLLLCGFTVLSLIQTRPLRASDHFAWGWALEKGSGKTTPEAMKHFAQAFFLKPDPNHAVSLITRAMKANDRPLAEKSAAFWMQKSNFSSLACYYGALAAFPDLRKMKICLDKVAEKELPRRLQFRYLLMQGDLHYRLKNGSEAVFFYKKALTLPEGTPGQRSYAANIIKTLEKKK